MKIISCTKTLHWVISDIFNLNVAKTQHHLAAKHKPGELPSLNVSFKPYIQLSYSTLKWLFTPRNLAQ